MRMCERHWAKLKEAIDSYGLSGLIAENGQQATELLLEQANGTSTVLEFDPLLGSNNMLWTLALQYTGMQAMVANENGSHKCPVCELQKYNWAQGAAWQARLEAEMRGLVPSDRTDIPGYMDIRTGDGGSDV